MERYEHYNEIIFETYCKKAIDNAILKERMKKFQRNQMEPNFSSVGDTVINSLAAEDDGTSRIELECQIFHVCGRDIPVYNLKLAKALMYLLPRDRNILLLSFFTEMKDIQIAQTIKSSRSTVQRRRTNAIEKLRGLMEADI